MKIKIFYIFISYGYFKEYGQDSYIGFVKYSGHVLSTPKYVPIIIRCHFINFHKFGSHESQ